MIQKRFTIRTFRGYDSFNTFGFAFDGAKSLILDIKADGWCDEYWWCEIIDNERGVSRIVTLGFASEFSLTRWLHLR